MHKKQLKLIFFKRMLPYENTHVHIYKDGTGKRQRHKRKEDRYSEIYKKKMRERE